MSIYKYLVGKDEIQIVIVKFQCSSAKNVLHFLNKMSAYCMYHWNTIIVVINIFNEFVYFAIFMYF